MGPLIVIKGEIRSEATVQLGKELVPLKVNILIFDATPQPLDENIIQCPAPSIHADRNLCIREYLRKSRTGKFRTLYFWEV
jgi:hypothetical protein